MIRLVRQQLGRKEVEELPVCSSKKGLRLDQDGTRAKPISFHRVLRPQGQPSFAWTSSYK